MTSPSLLCRCRSICFIGFSFMIIPNSFIMFFGSFCFATLNHTFFFFVVTVLPSGSTAFIGLFPQYAYGLML